MLVTDMVYWYREGGPWRIHLLT